MQEEDDALEQGQLPRAIGVEEGGEHSHGSGQQGAVLALWAVRLIPEDDETLDHGSRQEGGAVNACLPT